MADFADFSFYESDSPSARKTVLKRVGIPNRGPNQSVAGANENTKGRLQQPTSTSSTLKFL